MPDQPLPQHCPTPRELDDLELLTTGALAPITRFNQPGSVVTLALPDEIAAAERVELVDPEGLPLAHYYPGTGAVDALTHAQHGPFRALHLAPTQVRERHGSRTVVPVAGPLTTGDLTELADLGPVLLLALAGHGTGELSPVALVRATVAAAALLPDAVVVVSPLPSHGDPAADHLLGAQVAAAYAGADPVHALRSGPLPSGADAGPAGEADHPDEIADIVAEDRPAPDEQGLVLFFTGLSGSGKSTLAQALMDRILERGGRSITSLDGDVVRRHLSAGLTFSKADRETNIRRIGWVAAEISRHGGLAVCSPIAPFADTRAQVRAMVEDAGGAFFLVHVATPLEECERRDRKGLYAKARRGEIPEFTGISSPYEEPDDASVRVDTTGRTIEDALDDVIEALAQTGHLDLREGGFETGRETALLNQRGRETALLNQRGRQTALLNQRGRQTASQVEEVAQRPSRNPLDVLFVCTANICRSPHMEVTARRLAGDAPIHVHSAGVQGFTDHPMDDTMVATLDEADQPAAPDFRSRPLTARMVADADLVLTAERHHRERILEEHPEAVRKVFTLGQFAALVAEADPSLRGRALVEHARGRRTTPTEAQDIADPYRRGSNAAADTAGRISTMLSEIVPRLKEQ